MPEVTYLEALRNRLSQHGVHVLYNLPEVDGAKFYNTTAVVSPDGYVSKYRKRTLYVTEDLMPGERLTRQNLRAIRPGGGLPPKYIDVFLGLAGS